MLIEVMNGRYAGWSFPLPSGTIVRVGRGWNTELRLVDDPSLCESHMTLVGGSGEVHVYSASLDSPVYVNGATCQSAPLRHLDSLVAGQTLFRIVDIARSCSDDMASPVDRAIAILRSRNGSYLAMLDAALEPELAEQLGAESLFLAQYERDVTDARPVIARVESYNPGFERLLRSAWSRGRLVLIETALPLAAIREHFRPYLFLFDSQRRYVHYRFFDPRFLRLAFRNATPQQAMALSGPVAAFWLEDHLPRTLLEIRAPGVVIPHRLSPLEPLIPDQPSLENGVDDEDSAALKLASFLRTHYPDRTRLLAGSSLLGQVLEHMTKARDLRFARLGARMQFALLCAALGDEFHQRPAFSALLAMQGITSDDALGLFVLARNQRYLRTEA